MPQKFANTTRVMLAEPVEAFPLATIFAAGLTGTVVRYDANDDAYWVKLDRHIPVLKEWDNELQIYGNEGDWPADRYLSPITGTDMLSNTDGTLDHYVQAMCAAHDVEIDGDLWGQVFSDIPDADGIEAGEAHKRMLPLLKLAVHDKARDPSDDGAGDYVLPKKRVNPDGSLHESELSPPMRALLDQALTTAQRAQDIADADARLRHNIKDILKLARAFGDEVQAAFSAKEFREVCAKNKSGGVYDDDQCCATHEFCDANMLMLAAFKKAFGRDPLDSPDGHMTADDTTLWGDAWAVAKAAEFFA